MRIVAGFVLNQELSRVLFYPTLYGSFLMGFFLRSPRKAIRDHGIKCGRKNLLDLDYDDDFSILDESVSKMNELLEVL